jgi:hypothetical protein
MPLLRRAARRVVGMTAPTLQPDAEQHARQLIEQAARYVRAALEVPDDLETLRVIVATNMLEIAILRAQVEALERRAGVAC